MSPRRWLPTVIRARQAQEDLLAQQVATARQDADRAMDQLAVQSERVAGLSMPAQLSVAEFHAEIAGQQASIASLAAAQHRVQFADARLRSELDGLTEAARSRRSVEKMQERLDSEQSQQELAVAQREQDDIAITRHLRAAG
ncbi:MAG TPA: hypothetical protein VHO01_06230 [Jatrophihabitans sp.]|nr:hypothetical protein [Jatrophihabitans sp.]